jgi:hypothetical protein
MSKDKTLKRKNLPYVTAYLFLNALVFLLVNNLPTSFASGFDWTDVSKWAKTGEWALAAQVIALVLSWVIPHEVKDVLVFWRLRHPLPGCRAFTVYAKRDDRIDLQAIERKINRIPTDPAEQNKVWFKQFYLKVEKEPIVLDVHGRFLLFRELTAVAAILAPALAIPSFVFSSGVVPWAYAVALVMAFVLVSQAGRNAGQRFVCTVLARGAALPTDPAGNP